MSIRVITFTAFLFFLALLTISHYFQIDQEMGMEFLQGPIFTAFLALVLSFVVAKIVSFAVSNSTTDGNSDVGCVNEGAVAKGVAVDRGLRVRSSKGQKRVKFVDDVMIRRIDRFEGSENIGEVIVDEKCVDEKSEKRVDQFRGNNELIEEQCFRVKEMHGSDALVKGCEKVEMLIEKKGYGDNLDGVVSEKAKDSVIVEEGKIAVKLEGGDMMIDEKGGNGVEGFLGNEGLDTGDVDDEGKKVNESDVDDDWEGIERSELEKVFAEAVNYVEYGGKGKEKDDDRLAKLDNDVQMQLYGLHKVAVEGPCNEPQPMAIMVSARGKWNAWQRLGSLSQEAAMEQYIRMLSDSIPDWMHNYSADDDIQSKLDTVGKIPVVEHERKSELSATSDGDSSTGESSIEKDDAV